MSFEAENDSDKVIPVRIINTPLNEQVSTFCLIGFRALLNGTGLAAMLCSWML